MQFVEGAHTMGHLMKYYNRQSLYRNFAGLLQSALQTTANCTIESAMCISSYSVHNIISKAMVFRNTNDEW